MSPLVRVGSWLDLHPRLTALLALVATLLASAAVAFTIATRAEENSKFAARDAVARAERLAARVKDQALIAAGKQSALQTHNALCPLVYGYVHPVAGTSTNNRTDQLDVRWRAVGALVGCPDGVKP